MESRTAFSDSNDISAGGSSSTCYPGNGNESTTLLLPRDLLPPDVAALKRLSDTLESIFLDSSSPPDFDFFADARLVAASGKEIPVHRCILSARSQFFKKVFADKDRKAKVELKEELKEYEVGFDALLTVLAYVYSGKVRVSPKDVCVCVDDECSHLACWPAVGFKLEVLYASFVFQINELVARFQKNLMDILDKATSDDVLMVLSVANMCGTLCQNLVARAIDIVVKSDLDIITLDKALPHNLVKQIMESRIALGLQSPESNNFVDKHVKRIHRALESDDVELVRMLLKEDNTTLDDAYALHYAVAYCDSKTTTDLLDLAIADINISNPRGYTVLHVAARRKDPKIIVSLLTKGANPSDVTKDGRKALQISKRLTRATDYYKSAEEGKATPRDRLCIEILEQAERRDPLLGEASMSLAMAGDDLRSRWLYLEHRVALAQHLFPIEAQVAMDIAQVHGTSEFPSNGVKKNMTVTERTGVDLNEAPFKIKEEHLKRMRALSKTVELGKRFFPRCSAVLNKIMDRDEYPEIALQGNGSLEDSDLKRQRTLEISQAYSEDKEELERTINLTSSSPTSVQMIKPYSKFSFGN